MVVVDKEKLLMEINCNIFASKGIASNTNIVSASDLTKLFPRYDLDILTCFLKNMEVCQEVKPSLSKLIPLSVRDDEERDLEGEVRLLFFLCLLRNRPDNMTIQVFQFGWCLQCTREHDFFPPHYFHALSLNLAYKLALQKDEVLNCYCTLWRNGIHWFDGHGVGVQVEVVDESQCVLVLMSYEREYSDSSDSILSLRRQVIKEVISIYKESCSSLEVKEFIIDPEELVYPVNVPRERTMYSVNAVLLAIVKGQHYIVTTKGQKELRRILKNELLLDCSGVSLLGGRDNKGMIDHTVIIITILIRS